VTGYRDSLSAGFAANSTPANTCNEASRPSKTIFRLVSRSWVAVSRRGGRRYREQWMFVARQPGHHRRTRASELPEMLELDRADEVDYENAIGNVSLVGRSQLG